MDKVPKILIIVLASIVLLGVILFSSGTITGNSVGVPNCYDKQIEYEAEEEYLKTEYYTETVPYQEEVCKQEELIYSIRDFDITSSCVDYNERCIDYVLGICTEKETFCVEKHVQFELKVNNQDTKFGNWEIDFNMYAEGDLSQKKTQTVSVYPSESSQLYWTFLIYGEEDCSKKITGNYVIESVPTKTICETITKYKEVEREKQVTAYRPVTKYKNEQICE